MPELEQGQSLSLLDLDASQHFTEPPPRFNEASLVKELEENGIGRPSTYAQILATLQSREYTVKEEGRFLPDLYDRISFEVIRVAPLRERPEDIDTLAHYFLDGFAAEIPAFRGKRLSPRALAALQQLVNSHRESKNANRHLLTLADLYAELAVEYVESHPPEGLRFDPPRFEELVEAAARLYEAITNQDGAPEKLEAARRLEAFLAFSRVEWWEEEIDDPHSL